MTLIYFGECVVIPPILRNRVVQNVLGKAHPDIAADRDGLKLSGWWQGYRLDVKNCLAMRKMSPRNQRQKFCCLYLDALHTSRILDYFLF